jgi:hypothetical protein
MSDWIYVGLAYGVAWSTIAVYAVALRHRRGQARALAESMQQAQERSDPLREEDPACDAQLVL